MLDRARPVFVVVPIEKPVVSTEGGTVQSVLVREPTSTETERLAFCRDDDFDRIIAELVSALTGLPQVTLRALRQRDRMRVEAACASRFAPEFATLTDPHED